MKLPSYYHGFCNKKRLVSQPKKGLNFCKSIPLQLAGKIQMENQRTIGGNFLYTGEFPVWVPAFYIAFRILQKDLLYKHIPHLIAGAGVEYFMDYLVFFHR